MLEDFAKFLPRKCKILACNDFTSCLIASVVHVSSATGNFLDLVFITGTTGIARKFPIKAPSFAKKIYKIEDDLIEKFPGNKKSHKRKKKKKFVQIVLYVTSPQTKHIHVV